jgi:hypothetical protein
MWFFKNKSAKPAEGQTVSDPLRQVDLAFVVDTTGSMGAFIAAARQHMTELLRALTSAAAAPIDLRVGLVEYRDHPPQDSSFVAHTYAFSADLGEAQKVIAGLKPAGGGDGPEAVYDGLLAAGAELKWQPHSQRLMVLVGDAPPHGEGASGDGFAKGCPCGQTYETVTAALEQNTITLYAIGLTNAVNASFARLARYTGGEYFEAAKGEQVIETLRGVLAQEFQDLDFDRRVLAGCGAGAGWTIDALSTQLESSRGRISASLSRLGRRGLLGG